MKKARKLIFVVSEDWYFVSHRLGLALAAKREGYDVVVVTRCRSGAERITAAGLRCRHFDMSRSGLRPDHLLREAIKLALIYREEKPDIVHHVALRPVVCGGIASGFTRRTRVVAAITGLGSMFTAGNSSSLATHVLRKCLPVILRKACVVVQTKDDLESLIEFGIDERRLILIRGAGVDVSVFKLQDEPSGQPVVMLSCRLIWDKGVMEFVEASKILKSRGCGARFVIVGRPDVGNPSSVPLYKLREWDAERIVEYWGYREDMASAIAEASIVCLPSRYREGLPKVILEALATGRPCIATDNSGCREAIRSGYNGLLVPVGNVVALADAIQYLVDNPEERQRMGASGRERAVKEFDERIVIKQTLELYRRLVAAK